MAAPSTPGRRQLTALRIGQELTYGDDIFYMLTFKGEVETPEGQPQRYRVEGKSPGTFAIVTFADGVPIPQVGDEITITEVEKRQGYYGKVRAWVPCVDSPDTESERPRSRAENGSGSETETGPDTDEDIDMGNANYMYVPLRF